MRFSPVDRRRAREDAAGFLKSRARRFLLAFLPIVLLAGCGPRFDVKELDAVENELSARIAGAAAALGRLDGDALRAERDELVRLRLRAEKLRLPTSAWEIRAGLLAALDATADGLGAASGAVDLQREAQAPGFDPVRGKDLVDRSTRAMELCRDRLQAALDALNRVHEGRAKLEGR